MNGALHKVREAFRRCEKPRQTRRVITQASAAREPSISRHCGNRRVLGAQSEAQAAEERTHVLTLFRTRGNLLVSICVHTDAHTRPYAHTRTTHQHPHPQTGAHMHTKRTHTCTHTDTHAYTHTRTHTQILCSQCPSQDASGINL